VDDLSSIQSRVTQAENLLRIIDATAYSIPSAVTNSNYANLAPEIVSTLNGLWLLLSNSQSHEVKNLIITKWLPLLLNFTTIHASSFESTKPGHESRAKTILALVAIYLQLQALDVSTEVVSNLIEQSFDLALHLVDCLPDDTRQQCIRSLRDTISSPRLRYLFSFSADPTNWLILSQKERIPAVQGSGPSDGRPVEKEKLTPFALRRWEMLGEPTPNVGENDTSLSLTLFGARRG
jgi:mediator of RNA polymerase II transcription subunit 12